MRTLTTLQDVLKEQLKKPSFKKAFDEEEIYANIAINIAKMRERHNLTQGQLAKKLGTTQQAVSRIESQENESVTLRTLVKITNALEQRIEIKFVPYGLHRKAA